MIRDGALLVAALMTAALLAAAPAHAAGFLAGAGEEVTTPPAAGSADGNAADARFGSPAFAGCLAAGMTEGRFALQEPFLDQNHNGQWDSGASLDGSAPTGPPEPYCDANGNGRWDGIYADNGFGPAKDVHDPIDVRAFAISDGHGKPLVYASVKQIGLFDAYTEEARSDLKSTYGVDANLVVSANHNESSPDSIGLFGAGQTPLGVGVRSGIDEYYMSWLDDRIAHAAADAVHALRPAELYANQVEAQIPDGTSGKDYPLPDGLLQHISDQFPTSVALPNDDRVAAVDAKIGVLQAREPGGRPLFTVMSLAAHNQEMGFSGPSISADWPGVFESTFEASHPGRAIYLVGDNGSEEDPEVVPNGSNVHGSPANQFVQAQATGQRFAQVVSNAAATASRLAPGEVTFQRQAFCVPLENNGFVALAAAGEFGKRQGWACDQNGNPVAPVPNGSIVPTASTQFRTFVSYADIGPELQMIDNPGESFPALMLGSPFGKEEESCDRPNPPVPTWNARAAYRFQVGLADDLIGYLIPAWGFASGTPGLFNNDNCYQDMNGHGHKLESESVGPTGANDMAGRLAGMLAAEPDKAAHIVAGARFVLPNGTYSRWPTGATGILLPTAAGALDPNGGTLIGAPAVGGFGGRGVDANGLFMDYDGQPQDRPDLTTRGMMVFDSRGCPTARWYLRVFDPVDTSHPLGRAKSQPAVRPAFNCPGGGGIQPGAAKRAGLGSGCADRTPPSSVIRRARRLLRHGRLLLRGRATDRGCRRRVARVTVTVGRRVGRGRCRFLLPNGRLGARQSCRHGIQLLARGTASWRLHVRARLPRGRYVALARAVDTAGNTERARRRGPNVVKFRRR